MSENENEEKLPTRPEPVDTIRDLILDWERAVRHAEQLSRQLAESTSQIHECEQRIGKHLGPKDARVGEQFNIWFSNGLLSVRVLTTGFGGEPNWSVHWRQRPTKLY